MTGISHLYYVSDARSYPIARIVEVKRHYLWNNGLFFMHNMGLFFFLFKSRCLEESLKILETASESMLSNDLLSFWKITELKMGCLALWLEFITQTEDIVM